MLALRRVRGNAGWKMSEERGGLGWEGFAGGLSTGSALILPRASFPINTLCRHFLIVNKFPPPPLVFLGYRPGALPDPGSCLEIGQLVGVGGRFSLINLSRGWCASGH
jgi:hypothetical protein